MNKVIGSIVVASMVTNLFAAGWGQMGKAAIGKVAAEGAKNIATETPNNTAAVSSKEEVRRRQFIEQLKAMDNQKRQKTLGWLKSKNPAEFVAVMTMIKQEQGATKANADQGKEAAGAVSDTSPSAVSLEDIAKIEDDAQFFAAFKDATKSNNEVSLSRAGVFERACRMKDENLLVEFLTMYPERNARAADIHSDWSQPEFHVKSSKLAEYMLDNCNRSYKGYHANLCGVLFFATRVLDTTVREKYIKRANDNLAAAKNDEDLLVVDRYYVGMPVIDYVMRAFEEKRAWTKDYNTYSEYLHQWADTDTSCDDWKDWKMKTLHFTSKERAKTFKVKGTMDGFVEFLKKYVDKTAAAKDITVENGWWIYLDDPHELKMELNDNNGILNIYRQ